MNEENEKSLVNIEEKYSEKGFFEKIVQVAKLAGITVIYAGLLLYYASFNPKIPAKVKAIIIGALGYFIFPLDVISDFIPAVGYVDDLGILVAALVTVAVYIDDEVKQKAKDKLSDWFGEFDESELSEIDDKLNKE